MEIIQKFKPTQIQELKGAFMAFGKKTAQKEPIAVKNLKPSSGNGEWTPKPDFVGDFKNIKTKTGKDMQVIELSQDLTLKKGTLLIFQSLQEKLEWQVEQGYKTEDEATTFMEEHGERINGSFRILPPKA